ncbi:MAG: DUF58 domain-containing protein [Pseudomonadales bacterium]|nr:DUF58 domain-containing protein [Pseudomonadales bacterium]MDP7594090.1 DUF58 domain-containing protein [Pseudomonadales bacterium]HJN49127.1 DUF58 domain-containing protein [Pseudomonadales bacterium]
MSSITESTNESSRGEPRQSHRSENWLDRRLPPANSVTLSLRTVFILPTREGMIFALMLFVMVIAAINYQNSLIFSITFLLGSLFVVSILHTYRNLSGLTLSAGSTRAAFAGEDAEFSVIVSRQGDRTFEAIHLGWKDSMLRIVDLVDDEESKVRLYVGTSKRGILTPGRMLVQTFYPVGLFRAWSHVDLDMSTIVYPRPLFAGSVPPALGSSKEGDLLRREGVDDFIGLRDYQDGDGLRHIAWKSYARTHELFTKQFAAYMDRRVWLEWDYFRGMDRENRLSRLCYWVVQLAKSSDAYGLRLPGLEIAPASGTEHREEVLKALALFELE